MVNNNEATGRGPEVERRRPVFEARYRGLRVSVWRKESDKGPWFNVILSRSYLDESGSWQNANSFGARDLLEVAKLCNEAHTWIYHELAKERATTGQEACGQAMDDGTPD
jgi:hypothetical protein